MLMTPAGISERPGFNHFSASKSLMVFSAQFNWQNLTFLPRLDDVLDMYTRMLLVMGVVFQMPTLVFFLAKMGLVNWRFLAKQFKFAILVIFIIAAVVTPRREPYNQTHLALPIIR